MKNRIKSIFSIVVAFLTPTSTSYSQQLAQLGPAGPYGRKGIRPVKEVDSTLPDWQPPDWGQIKTKIVKLSVQSAIYDVGKNKTGVDPTTAKVGINFKTNTIKVEGNWSKEMGTEIKENIMEKIQEAFPGVSILVTNPNKEASLVRF